MNSTIRSVAFPSPGEVRVSGGAESVIVTAYDGIFRASVSVKPADFLAAVAAECDVIVIPREELPEVTEDSGCLTVGAGALTVGAATTVADADAAIREWVAIREYRMTHPPVDEAQVEALAEDMCAAGHVAISDGAIEARYAAARRLVALGWTKAVRP